MRHEFCCGNPIGRSWRTWKNEPNSTHIRRLQIIKPTSNNMLPWRPDIVFPTHEYYLCLVDGVSLCQTRSKMTLNHQMTVEGVSKSEQIKGLVVQLWLWNLLSAWRKNQEPTHHKLGNKPHPAPRGSLSMVGPTNSNSRRSVWHCILWLILLNNNHNIIQIYNNAMWDWQYYA
jgi:hypothetical protein